MANSNPLLDTIDFSVDYYAILGISKEDLPEGTSRSNRQDVNQVLEKAYRAKARIAHPDYGGSNEEFKLLLRAKWILEDPIMRRIYDTGGADKPLEYGLDNEAFEVDWSKFGVYRKGTTADIVGQSLFLAINKESSSLGITPAFYPTLPEHNYEWDWVLDEKNKLVLAIVHDVDEVLRLSANTSSEVSLPFKIHICIPRRSIAWAYDGGQWVDDSKGKKHYVQGRIRATSFDDFELLETTIMQQAYDYIQSGRLSEDLLKYRNGELDKQKTSERKKDKQAEWMDDKKMKSIDAAMLKELLMSKAIHTVPDPTAADFLNDLPQR